MTSDNLNELLPVVDSDGRVTGSATRGECHDGSHRFLHPVVHLHLFDAEGSLYLQRRPEWKDIQPGKWDTAVGGHVDYGEEIGEALRREAREELGLDLASMAVEPLGSYIFESDRERELINAFRCVLEAGSQLPRPTDELDGGRFWTFAEIEQAIGRGVLTPNFEGEFRRLFIK